MPTLRSYLQSAAGTFTSPNHPVPLSGPEMIGVLDVGSDGAPVPGTAGAPLEMEIEPRPQPAGDIWLYPVEAGGEDAEAALIHHPDIPPLDWPA